MMMQSISLSITVIVTSVSSIEQVINYNQWSELLSTVGCGLDDIINKLIDNGHGHAKVQYRINTLSTIINDQCHYKCHDGRLFFYHYRLNFYSKLGSQFAS